MNRRPLPVCVVVAAVISCTAQSPIGPTLTGSTISTAPALTSIPITAAATNVAVGSTLQLTATPSDQKGAPISATVTWSSARTSVATVIATTGLVTGVANGLAII